MIQTLMVLGQVWHVDRKETDEIQNICTSPEYQTHLKYPHITRYGAKINIHLKAREMPSNLYIISTTLLMLPHFPNFIQLSI